MKPKLKNFFTKLLSPFTYLKYKKTYFLFGIDLAFLIMLLVLGSISGKVSNNITSIGKATLISFVFLAIMLTLYSAFKYLFYKKLKQKRGFWLILRKHSLAVIVIGAISFLVTGLVAKVVRKIFLIGSVGLSQRIVTILLTLVGYLIFINYQNYDKGKLFSGLWNGIKSTFSSKTGKLIYADVAYILVFYVIYNVIIYISYLILVDGLNKIPTFTLFTERLGYVVIMILLVAMITTNKLIVYAVKPSKLK